MEEQQKSNHQGLKDQEIKNISGHKRNKDLKHVESTTRIHFNPREYGSSVSSSDFSDEDDDDEGVEEKREQFQEINIGSDGHVSRVKRYAESLSSINKEPWVPAPGRSTRPRSSTTAAESHQPQINHLAAPPVGSIMLLNSSHSSGTGDGIFRRGSRQNRRLRSQLSQPHASKNKGHQENDNTAGVGLSSSGETVPLPESFSLSGYTLQSKDSLVDVAACLNARREEVLKLWQQNISNVALVADVEKANQLAIDAAKDVNELRRSIQDLQQKATLTQEDSDALNQLRNRILSKLELFEQTHSEIQENLNKISSNALASASRSNSSTIANLAKANQSSQTSFLGEESLREKKQNLEIEKVNKDKSQPKSQASKSNQSISTNDSKSLIFLKNANPKFNEEFAASESEGDEDMLFMKHLNQHYDYDQTHSQQFNNNNKLKSDHGEMKKLSLDKISEENSIQINSSSNPLNNASSMPRKTSNFQEDGRQSRQTKHASLIKNTMETEAVKAETFRESSSDRKDSKNRHHSNQQKCQNRHLAKIPAEEKGNYPVFTTTASEASENGNTDGHGKDNYYSWENKTSSEQDDAYDNVEGQMSNDLNYYRHKLQHLHKKLLEQDTRYEELTRDVQKLESQSGFDLMLFKSSMLSHLQELEPYPELLEVAEKRLAETLHSKFILEADNQLRVQELKNAKNEIDKLTKELNESKAQLGTFQEKCGKLEHKVENYRMVRDTFTHKMANVQQELDYAQKLTRKSKMTSEREGDTTENLIYRDQIEELKRELKKERKSVVILKESKNSLSQRMSQRLEQVMQQLDESHRRNRTLQKQLRFIQSSYHNLFPSIQLPLFPVKRQGVSYQAGFHQTFAEGNIPEDGPQPNN